MRFLRPGLQGRSSYGSLLHQPGDDEDGDGVEQFGDFAVVVDDRGGNGDDYDDDDMASSIPPNCKFR